MAEATPKKARKSTKQRTDKDLKEGSLKDKLFFLIRNAYRLAGGSNTYKTNAFKGVKSLEDSKLPSAVFARASHPSAPYWKELGGDLKDARLKQFRDKVSAAQKDIAAGNYSKNVKDALQDYLDIKGEFRKAGGGGGSFTINPDTVLGVSI